MSWRLIGWLSAIVAIALVSAELLLQPADGGERLHLMLILGAPAAVTVVLSPLLARWLSARANVASTALLVGLCSLALGTITTSAASNAMFLSSHDYRLFLVVLLLSSGIALAVGSHLARPLAIDIARVGDVAEQVAAGDLTARTGVTRRDEIGRAARAVDSMVIALDDAAQQRARAADARQLLVTSIGHDLRTPLAAMRAAVESLQDGIAPDPQRYLGILGAQLHNIEALLDQFVEYARIESGLADRERTTVSMSEMAHEAVEALSPVADRMGVGVKLDSDGPAIVVASHTDMARVLRNLLENAIRHSPAGESVSIDVRSGSQVEVSVADRGPGFPSEFRDRAFEPFTRADPARDVRTGHSGLGLAIARAVVEAHGGRIWLANGHGADVRFAIPRREPG
ncbi:MAG TPA: HAMP domain-containing sensor histidine kinase [Ilumatobacteraceae bacterium]|nr:HAMP domain-containing sensor histidine kinase [Ilumatobacteraceae bacterium]